VAGNREIVNCLRFIGDRDSQVLSVVASYVKGRASNSAQAPRDCIKCWVDVVRSYSASTSVQISWMLITSAKEDF